jgi:CDP-6-deoxy-D-xylo-4-hexulose-3-dehydrase
MNNTLWLGIYPGLTKEMLDFVALKIENYLGLSF